MGDTAIARSTASAHHVGFAHKDVGAPQKTAKQFDRTVLFVDMDGTTLNSLGPIANKHLDYVFDILHMPETLREHRYVRAIFANVLLPLYEMQKKDKDGVNGGVLNGVKPHDNMLKIMRRFEKEVTIIGFTGNENANPSNGNLEKMLKKLHEKGMDNGIVYCPSDEKSSYIRKYMEENETARVIWIEDSTVALKDAIRDGLRGNFLLAGDWFNFIPAKIAEKMRIVGVGYIKDYESMEKAIGKAIRT